MRVPPGEEEAEAVPVPAAAAGEAVAKGWAQVLSQGRGLRLGSEPGQISCRCKSTDVAAFEFKF